MSFSTENSDIDEINSGINKYVSSAKFKEVIEKIVRDRIKNEKELDNKIVDITKNVLSQLYKTLWTKRATWLSGLSNKTS